MISVFKKQDIKHWNILLSVDNMYCFVKFCFRCLCICAYVYVYIHIHTISRYKRMSSYWLWLESFENTEIGIHRT